MSDKIEEPLGFTKLAEKLNNEYNHDIKWFLTMNIRTAADVDSLVIKQLKAFRSARKRLMKQVNRYTYLLIYFDGNVKKRPEIYREMEKLLKKLDKHYKNKKYKFGVTPTLSDAIELYDMFMKAAQDEFDKNVVAEIHTQAGEKYMKFER